jgi:hypothetical protein
MSLAWLLSRVAPKGGGVRGFFVRLFQQVLNGVFVNVVDVMNYESRTVDVMNILSVCCFNDREVAEFISMENWSAGSIPLIL